MKFILFSLALLVLISCQSNNKTPGSADAGAVTQPAPLKIVNATSYNAALDSLVTAEKVKQLDAAHVEKANWVDAYCPVCGRRCCSPCFAGASRDCAYLKFQDCSVCGHASAGHYAVAHQ